MGWLCSCAFFEGIVKSVEGDAKSVTIKKIAGKTLKTKQSYKVKVKAYRMVDGKEKRQMHDLRICPEWKMYKDESDSPITKGGSDGSEVTWMTGICVFSQKKRKSCFLFIHFCLCLNLSK